jgi:hypothetical protein
MADDKIDPKADASKKPLCFVIGPIGHDGTAERKHADLLLHTLLKHVLEADEFGYQVKRADEDADPGMIGDRMVSDIIRADLVVSDLTDLNPNAFYELGIRHSTERPTIHVAKLETKLPFDNVTHRTIFVDLTDWRSIENARAQLAASARAIKAPGYRVSNPITQANASFKMRESADPRDRVIARLQERLATMESRLEDIRQTRLEGAQPRATPSPIRTGNAVQAVEELYAFALSLLAQKKGADDIFDFVRHIASEILGLSLTANKSPSGWTISFDAASTTMIMDNGDIYLRK